MAAQKVRTIDVYANPYAALDADGVPQGVVQMPGTRNYVGAFLDIVASEKTGKNRFYFTGEKVTVPFTPEVARAVLEGGLIVADAEHARMVGLSPDDFIDAKVQLHKEQERALSELKAMRGDAAKVEAVPSKATERDDSTPGANNVLAGPKNNPSVVLRPREES